MPMVSRQPAYRKFLDLQNAKSATAWIMSFVSKCCFEKNKDKINTNGIHTASRQKFWIYRMQNQLMRG